MVNLKRCLIATVSIICISINISSSFLRFGRCYIISFVASFDSTTTFRGRLLIRCWFRSLDITLVYRVSVRLLYFVFSGACLSVVHFCCRYHRIGTCRIVTFSSVGSHSLRTGFWTTINRVTAVFSSLTVSHLLNGFLLIRIFRSAVFLTCFLLISFIASFLSALLFRRLARCCYRFAVI